MKREVLISPPVLVWRKTLKSKCRRSGPLVRLVAHGEERRRTTTINASTVLTVKKQEQAQTFPIPVESMRGAVSEQCARFVQQQLASALPAICESLLEKARNGDVACARALWRMAEFDRRTPRTNSRRPGKLGLGFARKVLAEFKEQ